MAKRIPHPSKGREWFTVDVNDILAHESLEMPRVLLGHHLVLRAYCASQSNGGLLRRPDGSTIRAIPSLGIRPLDLRALVKHGLVRQVGNAIEVLGYDIEREKQFQAQSLAGRAAAMLRWGREGFKSVGGDDADPNAVGSGDRNANRSASGNSGRNADQRRGDEKNNPPSPPVRGDIHSMADPPGFLDFWAALPSFLQEGCRADAVVAWKALALDRDPEAQSQILKALDWQRRSDSWVRDNRARNLTPKTYLRKRRWEGGPVPKAERTPKMPREPDAPAESPSERQARYLAGAGADDSEAARFSVVRRGSVQEKADQSADGPPSTGVN